jgi:hypothetical protein
VVNGGGRWCVEVGVQEVKGGVAPLGWQEAVEPATAGGGVLRVGRRRGRGGIAEGDGKDPC